MKKYFFEADRRQWEKPTEPKPVLCPPARVWVLAEDEESARAAAREKLRAAYHGTGMLLGDELRLTETAELPTDWSYGYGEGRGAGAAADRDALWRSCTR